MKTPHKHADVIKAWAEGAKIQWRHCGAWEDVLKPNWFDDYQYRVKPTPDVVKYVNYVNPNADRYLASDVCTLSSDIKITFDGETKLLKSVEIVR